MNVNMVCQGKEEKYPDAYVVAGENFCFRDFAGAKTETIKGLHSIIVLSMQCLEIVLRHGHIRRYDRDSLIQDNDPYVEGLLNSIRNGKFLHPESAQGFKDL